MVVSTRSRVAKTKTTTNSDGEECTGTTFLSGVNFECASVDPLSFPDPPTPQKDDLPPPAAAAALPRRISPSKRRRRFSSPMLPMPPSECSKPLQDVTNESSMMRSGKGGSSLNPSLPVEKKKRQFRGRKSMSSFLPPKANSRRKSSNLLSPLKSASDDDNSKPYKSSFGTVTASRRKKRKSIFLPSEMSPDDHGLQQVFYDMKSSTNIDRDLDLNCNFKSSSLQHAPKKNESSMICASNNLNLKNSESCIRQRARASADGKGDDTFLLQMVREYCTLPISDRSLSQQAETIERLSGYNLVEPLKRAQMCTPNANSIMDEKRKRVHGEGEKKHGSQKISLNGFKRDLLTNMVPIVSFMEERKKHETERIQKSTKCRVEKKAAKRGGGFCYKDIYTGETVDPNEYQARYLVAIQAGKRKWKRPINDDETDENLVVKSKEPNHSVFESCSFLDSPSKSKLSSNIDNKDCCDVPSQERVLEYANNLPGSESRTERAPAVSIDDMDMSMDMDENNVSSFLSPAASDMSDMSECMTPTYLENSSHLAATVGGDTRERSLSLTPLSTNENVLSPLSSGVKINKRRCSLRFSISSIPSAAESNNDPGSNLLPSPPSREDPSSDPDIAAAEKKLWFAIDAALDTYSQEVLDIMATREINCKST